MGQIFSTFNTTDDFYYGEFQSKEEFEFVRNAFHLGIISSTLKEFF